MTNASIVEQNEFQNRDFYEDNFENPNLIKTIEEAESYEFDKKEGANTNSNENSFTHSQVENKLFEKITDKIDEKEIDSEKHIPFYTENLEDKDGQITLSQQYIKQIKREQRKSQKKEFIEVNKTETGGTPLLVKGESINFLKALSFGSITFFVPSENS